VKLLNTRAGKLILGALAAGAVYAGGYVTNIQSGDHPVHNAIARAAFAVDKEAVRVLHAGGFACGVERWAEKTLSASDDTSVSFKPQATNVPKLVALPAPGQLDTPRNAPGHESELRTYLLSGVHLIAYKQEPDSDIHLELQSTIDGSTMIAEIPDPNCVTSPFKRAQIAAARLAFSTQVGQPTGSYQTVNVAVRITGTGFFDFAHGQRGVAHNAIELHPVLSFRRLP
jgi:hypothetical protein